MSGVHAYHGDPGRYSRAGRKLSKLGPTIPLDRLAALLDGVAPHHPARRPIRRPFNPPRVITKAPR